MTVLPTQAPAPTTRDLLAEIASREPHEPRPKELDRRERRYVRWSLTIIVLVTALLFAILWWLDPISVTGRQTRFSVVENGGVRQAKLDLMENLKAPPKVMVLGSSRSMKIDPASIQKLTGDTAFNAGVSGGTSKDMYLYARYAEQLWANDGNRHAGFPHLVIGLMNDVLRNDSTAAFDPRLRRFLPSSQRRPGIADQAKALLQWKTMDAAQRAVRSVVPRDGVRSLIDPEGHSGAVSADLAIEGAQRGNKKENFTPQGFQLFAPVKHMEIPIHSRVRAQMKVYAENSYTADAEFTGADDIGIMFLRRTIQLANRNGDVPTLWKTPFQPWGKQFLPRDEYEARDERFEEVMRELKKDTSLQFNYYREFDDLAYYGGDPDAFYDGIHQLPSNTDKVLAKLDELGVLAKDAKKTTAAGTNS
jgi:hypothetical protein